MDQEKLIENVKSCEPLYVMSHPKYSDTVFKEHAWKEIAKEMNQSAKICKKTWASLRDSFRRALKKKRETKSGQAASKIKKWKFEEEMSFLLPIMQERDTCSNLKDVSDDDNEEEPTEDEYDIKNDRRDNRNNDRENDRNDDREDDRNDDREDDQNDDRRDDRNTKDDNKDDVDEVSHVEDEKKKKRKENRKISSKNKEKNIQPETVLAVMKYLIDKKNAEEQITPPTQPNAIDTFFSSIAATVKTFSPYYQNIAKSKILSIITELEMKQFMQEQSFFVPSTQRHTGPSTHSQMQYDHTGSYNVQSHTFLPPSRSPSSSIISLSPSPSKITATNTSPSYYEFPKFQSHEENFNEETTNK